MCKVSAAVQKFYRIDRVADNAVRDLSATMNELSHRWQVLRLVPSPHEGRAKIASLRATQEKTKRKRKDETFVYCAANFLSNRASPKMRGKPFHLKPFCTR
jgi:hypothetical protein